MPECRRYDICGLSDEADPEAQLCILHSKSPDKDTQEFYEALNTHRQRKGDDFKYVFFPKLFDFKKFWGEDKVSRKADFSWATFSQGASFGGVKFSDETLFYHAIFCDLAVFSATIFLGPAIFNDATFSEEGYFADTCFRGLASFSGTTFSKEANFRRTKFFKGAWLAATFSGRAYFSEALISSPAMFSHAAFFNGAQFDDVIFCRDIEVTFYASQFRGRMVFTNAIFTNSQKVDFQNVIIDPPDVVTFNGSDLRQCRFLGTDLRKVHFTGVTWPRVSHLWWKRRVVYDEKVLGQSAGGHPWDHIERLYRQLKQNYEDQRDYERAGDFHYGEKEMRRQNRNGTPWGLRQLLWLYKAVSGYGERALPPLIWAGGVLVLFAFLYMWFELSPTLPNPNNLPSLALNDATTWSPAITYSLQVMTWQKPQQYTLSNFWPVILYTIQSLLGPLLLGLSALAIRQRMKR